MEKIKNESQEEESYEEELIDEVDEKGLQKIDDEKSLTY